MASQTAKQSETVIDVIGIESITGLGISMVHLSMEVKDGKLCVAAGTLRYKGLKYTWKAMNEEIPEDKKLWVIFYRGKVRISEDGKGIALGEIYDNAGQLRGWRRYYG